MPIVEEGLSKVVGRHEDAIEAVCAAGVHILLAGHFHRSFSGSAREAEEGRPGPGHPGRHRHSTRLRAGEAQSFNLVHARRNDEVDLQVVEWDGAAFHRTASHARFTFDSEKWHSAPVTAQA